MFWGNGVGVYSVLVHSGQRSSPARHLVTAIDTPMASEIADDLLRRSLEGVGVEVVSAGERLYVRGVVPVRAARLTTASSGDSAPGDLEAGLPLLQAYSERQIGSATRSRASFRT
jgi:hypothetical protein